jgi:hypothetical protein
MQIAAQVTEVGRLPGENGARGRSKIAILFSDAIGGHLGRFAVIGPTTSR